MKRKGSFTIVIACLLVLVFSFWIVIMEYMRIETSHKMVQESVDKVTEIGLVFYNPELFEYFSILAFDSEQSAERLEHFLEIELNDRSSRLLKLTTELKAFEIKHTQSLEDVNTIKSAIMFAHTDHFIVGEMKKWLDKVGFFEMLSELVTSLNSVLEFIEELAHIQSSIEGVLATQESINYYLASDEFNALVLFTGQFNNSLTAYKKLINEYNHIANVLSDRDDLSEEDREILLNELSAIESELQVFLDQKANAVSLCNDFYDFLVDAELQSRQLGELCESLSKSIALLDGTLGLQFEQVSGVFKSMKQPLLSARDNLYVLENSLGIAIPKCHQILTFIEAALTYEINLESELITSLEEMVYELENLVLESFDIEKLIPPVLARPLENEIDLSTLLDVMVIVFERLQYMQGDTNGAVIDLDIFENLPSKAYRLNYEVKNSFKESLSLSKKIKKIIDMGLSNKAVLTQFSESIKENGKNLWERIVIGDYIVSYFSFAGNVETVFKERESHKTFGYSEVEYVLYGARDSRINRMLADSQIGSIRFAMNALSIIFHKQAQLQQISTPVATALGGISYPLVYGLVLTGWSGMESYLDILLLKKGEHLEVFKGNGSFNLDFSLVALNNLLKSISVILENPELVEVAEKVDSNASDSTLFDDFEFTMSYRDYLLLLLLTQDETIQLKRVADIWQVGISQEISKFYREIAMEVTTQQKIHGLAYQFIDEATFSRKSYD